MRVYILTQSSKYSGKCVAGISAVTGDWVRLVSNDKTTHGAIPNWYLFYENGEQCQILDLVDVPDIGVCGDDIQPENILVDTSTCMVFVRKASLQEVLIKHPPEKRWDILGNKYSYITAERVKSVGYSLSLVEVSDLTIWQVANPSGNPKTKADFTYCGDRYTQVSVTDPEFYTMQNGSEFDRAILVMSIGTPYNEKYYKFIAKIFVL